MSQSDRVVEQQELPAHLHSIGAGLDFTDPNSPLAPYYMRTSEVVAAALLAVVFFFLNVVPLWHTDIWGHLKYGQWIVYHHRLPEKDVLCVFADPQATSLHVYWLCQTGYALAYNTGAWIAGGDSLQQMSGGVQMLRTLHATLIVARCILLLLALRRLGCSPAMACTGLFVLLLLSCGQLCVTRPQVLGEFFLACLLFALSRKELSRRALVLLPIVLVIWANCHGSFVLGLTVLAACLCGEIIRVAIAQRSFQLRLLLKETQIQRLGIALLASAIAIAVFNPHGPFIYPITFAMSRHPNVLAMDEWQPISLLHPNAVTFIYLATIVLLLGTQLFSRQWYSPVQLMLIAVFGIQPVLHQRMMVWWLMLVPWLALPLLATALERLPYYWRLPPAPASFRKTVIAGLIIAVLVLWSPPAQWLVTGKTLPVAQNLSQGTPWLLAQELKQPSERKEFEWQKTLAKGLETYPNKEYHGLIFTSETLGDYFSWSLPQTKRHLICIDTHVHLFTPEYWQRILAIKSAHSGWQEMLGNTNLIVVEAEKPPNLRDAVKQDADWLVILDETGSPAKLDPRCRLFVALRKKPK